MVIQSPTQDDTYATTPLAGWYNDAANDSLNGGRFQARILRTWDHNIDYIEMFYPAGIPVVAAGFSKGALQTATIAAYRSSTIKAFMCHCLPTILENVGSALTPGYNFGISWTGLDLGPSFLAGCPVPGIFGYNTGDTAAGYDSAGTSGTPVSNTQLIVTNSPSWITGVSNPSGSVENHELSTADGTYFSGTWFAGTGPNGPDVLCPKVF